MVQTEKDARRAEQDKVREAKAEAAQKIKEKIKATRWPRNWLISMRSSDPRIVAETRRCSSVKRFPPPWPGIPVKVPQPCSARDAAAKAAIDRLIIVTPGVKVLASAGRRIQTQPQVAKICSSVQRV